MAPIPNSWQSLSFRGGNLLCELTQAASLQNRVQILFSSSGSCASNVFETMVGDTTTIMKVILSLTKPNVTAIKFQEQFNSPASSKLISQTLTFVQTYVPPIELLNFQLHARRVKLYLRDEVNISMVQYVWNTNGYALATLNYFDPMEVDFEFFAWLFMFDWVQGIREVVSFEGDTGNLTTMSTSTTFQIAVNPMEIPLNIANYMRWFLQYITWVMLGVACLVCFYIIGLRGQIEASNMISFSRVTSLVWIGRPLILLRALSAVCLLATSTLQLTRPHQGLVSFLKSEPQHWYTIVLAASELNWMVFIINDVCSVATSKFTRGYSMKSFTSVWVVSAIWAFAAPEALSVAINRECSVVHVDFQVICTGGTIAIGSVNQFYSLIGLCIVCCVVSYVVERMQYKTQGISRSPQSHLLYATAKHQFQTRKWEFQGVQFLDKASAVLTGVISLPWRDELYIFDVKTWRIYTISADQLGFKDANLPMHLVCAIPLVE
ncbi:Aste57867_6872 [Aphanomyces stellatus]|uniref:Aste57867_6872 protein n=1 Tax=Aphanomyces stellatus TaxID=120398 RepID=A0A485KG28_9STRA|nr:hypothetical protein As57867_006851 [Aphanomyces stellatus]VFT83829.1 Aste57867_6872 [Aphanomyces stellatus]